MFVESLPRYSELMLPVLRAVATLGGSAQARQITDEVISTLHLSEEALSLQYAGRSKSIVLDRIDWARSYCKLAGVLDSPKRALFVLTTLGKEILDLTDDEARDRLRSLDAQVRATRRNVRDSKRVELESDPDQPQGIEGDESTDSGWREDLMARLHVLSPQGFEEFALFLLRAFGLELRRTGASGDEGIDGLGIAPISPVLSSTVAVQAKRFAPGSPVGREVVALFQRDAAAAGAERAVLITLGRFTDAARKASRTTRPTVDLIDGDRICDLVLDQGIGGLRLRYHVEPSWFDRFDS